MLAPHPKAAARRAAIRALSEIETNNRVLGAAIDDALKLSPEASRPLTREIVSGVLRHRARLDWTLAPLLKKPLSKLDAIVRAALRAALYERLELATPAAVAANEYAGLMRGEKLSSATGFVNAVARRLPAAFRAAPDAKKNPALHLATEYSHPQWLVEKWLTRLGFDETVALCAANNQIAPLCLRATGNREGIIQSLRERGLAARVGVLSPDAIIVENGGNPTDWPEWEAGKIIAQDEAAQLVSLWADPQPGQTVIDAAAAPGGKTTHLAQLMNRQGTVIACDVSAGRLKLVAENARRLKMEIELRDGDFRALSNELPRADLVLLDAPCSGTGTLRRRPDAKWRKTPKQLAELVVLQRELLNAAARSVRVGGHLVYSTCSLESEENEAQVLSWLRANEDWQIAPVSERLPAAARQALLTSDGFLQSWPHLHGCDGMFAARLRRIA